MENEMNGTKPGVDNVRDATDRFVSDAKTQVNSVIDEAAEMANDLFGRAERWIGGSDSGRVIGLVAVVAAAGFLGYLIGRRGISETVESLGNGNLRDRTLHS